MRLTFYCENNKMSNHNNFQFDKNAIRACTKRRKKRKKKLEVLHTAL